MGLEWGDNWNGLEKILVIERYGFYDFDFWVEPPVLLQLPVLLGMNPVPCSFHWRIIMI
jgi:hypothetical protein